jgi:hypothetical protein
MYALVLTTLLSLPMYPINPVKQDTLNMMNMHFSIGITAPNGLVKTGVEFSAKYEFLIVHPLVLRVAADYRISRMKHVRYPEGTVYGPLLSLEALYYRGTNRLTGFIGGGAVLALYAHSPSQAVADSLELHHDITDTGFKRVNGYRLTFGLRFHRTYSLEVSITDVRPSFVYSTDLGDGSYSRRYEKARFNDFRVSFGYLLPLYVGRHRAHGPG